MVTLSDLKKAKMMALKEHDTQKGNILGVIIAAYQKSEIEKKGQGKEMTEADMVSVLNKVVKELSDEKEMYVNGGRPDEAQAIDRQMAVVRAYLPTMMSEEEIRDIIGKLDDKSVKAVMAVFKTQYAGKADMGLVSRIAKTYQA